MEMVDIQMFSVYLYLYRYSHTMVNNMNLRLLKRILTGFLLNFFIMTTTALYAQPLTEQTARLCATDFWQKKHPAHKRLVPEMVLYHAGSNGYIFVPSEEGGFVWIGGQGDAPVVKGYSTVSQIRDKAMPEILRFCLDNATIPATATKDDVFTETVSPLLTSEWEQASPYNGLCPYYKYDDGTISQTRCLVGCVATATSEVLRYYAHPEALKDTLHGWETPHYSIEDVLPGTRINWNDILDSYEGTFTDEQARAVQELSLYTGMACRMNYGTNASGSQIYYFLNPLQDIFDYRYVTFYDRAKYSPTGWKSAMRYELNRGIPLVYSAHNFEGGGHAFVVDGMDENGLFHIRWGYGSDYNGYFDIDILNAYERLDEQTESGRLTGLFCNQAMLSFYPDSIAGFKGDTLTYQTEDVTIDSVSFLRQPDLDGYVPVDITLTNHSQDTICYTLAMFSTVSQDTVDWKNIKTLGLTGLTLYPGTTVTTRAYCLFYNIGHSAFGITPDGIEATYLAPFTLKKTDGHQLGFGPVSMESCSDGEVTLLVNISNNSDESWAGDLITYCLFEEGSDIDYRHWSFMNLQPGEHIVDTVRFGSLKPACRYTLYVRCPWDVRLTYTFKTSETDGVQTVNASQTNKYLYSLQGILMGTYSETGRQNVLKRLPRGYYMEIDENGRKTLIRNC